MASALCCIAEEDSRANSPELPNARVSQATPSKLPLLPQLSGSPSSRFTSARTEEIHELRELFDHARDGSEDKQMPLGIPRARFSRPSIPSLHSIRTIASLHSVIKHRLSRNWSKKDLRAPTSQRKLKNHLADDQSKTVLKQAKLGPNKQLQITKDHLRRDLMSDKNPDEGGYDSDAEVLDDVARDVGKRITGKRPSIHSIDWSPSTASKHTLGSSIKERHSAELKRDVKPYCIEKPQTTSFAARFSHVFSTPNLRLDSHGDKDRKLRRSLSASSMGLPKPSPISPLRLPSLSACDSDGVPWSEVMSESLRLSHFPAAPHEILPKESEIVLNIDPPKKTTSRQNLRQILPVLSRTQAPEAIVSPPVRPIEIRLQQPTSTATPRESTSVRGGLMDNEHLRRQKQSTEPAFSDEQDEDPRKSVHLYSMRISHHLRSGSLLSWDQLADAPELPSPPHPFRERTVSDQSRCSRIQKPTGRHGRETSSSGFASSKVPSKWGKVVSRDESRPDIASSIYSSRPQSPPESYGGSMINLSRGDTGYRAFSGSSIDVRKPRRSRSFPLNSDDTPRATNLNGIMIAIPPITTNENNSPATIKPLARKNSVADTKKSKFREEFSPSPPKRRLTQTTSIIKFLNPKRLSMRSQSEANIKPEAPVPMLDGPFETMPMPSARDRRQSRSLMSLQAEQDALGKGKGADCVWDRALQAHREEKGTLYLPKNKNQALSDSPFRERSGSIAARRTSFGDRIEPGTPGASSGRQDPPTAIYKFFGDIAKQESAGSRRSALARKDDIGQERAVSLVFETQGDGPDVVGAWGRYPSHTRRNRTLSAGKADLVEARDFALEAAIRFATNEDVSHDDDLIDPVERCLTLPLLPRQKKVKKRIGHSRMAKSNSMTFGRTLMKNYTKMFKSQSTEFRRHGKGHRSSITSGGILEFPELELVPSAWTGEDGDAHIGSQIASQLDGHASDKPELAAEDSMVTLRPRRNSSAPDLTNFSFRDDMDVKGGAEDRARVWSIYYENCVPSFPRLSMESDFGLKGSDRPGRLSMDSKHAVQYVRHMPGRSAKHSRNNSQMSPKSMVSLGSEHFSLMSLAQDDGAADEKSIVSVRRSTMDLISKFKLQEATEHAALITAHNKVEHKPVS